MKRKDFRMLKSDREFLRIIGRGAGTLALKRKAQLVIDHSDQTNVSTNVEKEINEYYENMLRKVKNTPVISEENFREHFGCDEESFWLVDSIDGTLSYINGFSSYVTQFAFIEYGVPTYGLVFAPETNELFEGISGEGAYLNERILKCYNQCTPRSIIDNTPEPNKFVARLMQELQIDEYVESGSIGLKLCRVADGKADIFVKLNSLEYWDWAPGWLIVREAGGFISNINGSPLSCDLRFKTKGLFAAKNFDNELQEIMKALLKEAQYHE